jgi:hypothetical protein
MKKVFFIPLAGLALLFVSSCQTAATEVPLVFAQSEYSIRSGDAVTVNTKHDGISYQFLESVQGVNLESRTGVITFSDDVINDTQLLYQANYGEKKSDVIVITLTKDVATPTLTFTNLSSSISDGDSVSAVASSSLSVAYALTSPAKGISIEKSSGIVHFTDAVSDGESFNVTATSSGATLKKDFVAVTEKLVTSSTKRQVAEKDKDHPIAYFLDFSAAPEGTSTDLLGVMENGKILDATSYAYDATQHEVVIKGAYLKTLIVGEHTLQLVTSRNVVSAPLLIVNKFITSAEDLASINDSQEALSGYYVQTQDIDLTSYLAEDGAGYNDGLGWNPIGKYHDVTDGTAYSDSFKGTYDGAGHVIKGLSITRSDEYAFNAGLFGYVYSTATISNLGVESSTPLAIRSYSGGFVGANAGIIKNCYAKVDVSSYSGSNVFKVAGGFAGRNEGTIDSCYSLGSVNSDDQIGAFCGWNLGKITNSFALASATSPNFLGSGATPDSDAVFADQSSMNGFDYSTVFSSDDWLCTAGQLPTLKNTLNLYFVMGLTLNKIADSYTRGDKINLGCSINPANLQSQYEGAIAYSVVGNGYSITDGVLDTTAAVDYDFTITAALTVDGVTYSDSHSVHLYDKVETLTIDKTTDPILDAGHRYQLRASVAPTTADQHISWSLAAKVDGVSINGDIISISEICTRTNARILCKAGTVSQLYIPTIRPLKYVTNAPIVLHQNDVHDLHFTLPSGVDTTGLSVTRYGKAVLFTTSGQEVIVSSDYVTAIPGKMLNFNLQVATGDTYRAIAGYLEHALNDEASVRTNYPSVISLSSVDDFARYFNLKDYDETRYANYAAEKTYLLTADLDFAYTKTYGLGSEDHPFLATIYGNGHTLSNFGQGTATAMDGENYFSLSDDAKTSKYRSSLYVVGFFSVFGGKAYDLRFDAAKIKGNNFVGGFAGKILEDAYVENVHFTNSTVININEVSHNVATEDHVAGFACINAGTLVDVSYDGNTINIQQGNY